MNTTTENKWDEAGEKAWQAIFSSVKAMRFGPDGKKMMTLEAIAKKVGAGNKSTIAGWLKEDRGGKDIAFPDMFRYLENLGFDIYDFIPRPTMRRMGAFSPVEIVQGEGLIRIPIYEKAGAGTAVDLFSLIPEKFIYVLPQYARADVGAIEVSGDSMEPTIKKGSIVGIVPYSGEIDEGHIYLVRLPPLGLVVKRIAMGREGKLVLKSDNKAYESVPFPDEGHDGVIAGKVIWVWQEV